MPGNRHLDEWAKNLNLGLFPICAGGIVAALTCRPADRYVTAWGAMLVGFAFLTVMALLYAPVIGDLRSRVRHRRQNNYLATDLARTVMPLGPLFRRAWPAALGWFVLSCIALLAALRG